MPYESNAQRKFFHTDTAKKAGITDKEVKEFDQASKGMKLPEKKKSPMKTAHEYYEKYCMGGKVK